MDGWLIVLIIVVLSWLTVKKGWLYDPTHPERPKKTPAAKWFRKNKP
ncbi:hypothetical protein K8O68_02095 [Salipaludibacillus sp. CUR1]|nr:hypothetical protein [Salipaludibacillus sp. CUR1]MCE7791209.1 hypothetical protein [Salipaludibacillus sp. CUR1]